MATSAIGSELPQDGDRRHGRPDGDQDPEVASAGDQLREVVEVGGKSLRNGEQLIDLEVCPRGDPAEAALGRRLPVPAHTHDRAGGGRGMQTPEDGLGTALALLKPASGPPLTCDDTAAARLVPVSSPRPAVARRPLPAMAGRTIAYRSVRRLRRAPAGVRSFAASDERIPTKTQCPAAVSAGPLEYCTTGKGSGDRAFRQSYSTLTRGLHCPGPAHMASRAVEGAW